MECPLTLKEVDQAVKAGKLSEHEAKSLGALIVECQGHLAAARHYHDDILQFLRERR